MNLYTPASPCRCGHDGQGVHRCHYARKIPGEACQNPAVDRLVPTAGALAGMQLKFSCVAGHYCAGHWELFDREKL